MSTLCHEGKHAMTNMPAQGARAEAEAAAKAGKKVGLPTLSRRWSARRAITRCFTQGHRKSQKSRC